MQHFLFTTVLILAWTTAEKERLKKADLAARHGAAEIARREGEVSRWAAAIEAKLARHEELVRHARAYLAAVGAFNEPVA